MDPALESALDGLDKTGASESERTHMGMLARHGEEEAAHLQRYQRFAKRSLCRQDATSYS